MLGSSHYQESEIVRVTFIVLFLSLVIVYVAYFHLNYDRYFATPQVLPGGDLLVSTGNALTDSGSFDSSLLGDLGSLPGDFTSNSSLTSLSGSLGPASTEGENMGTSIEDVPVDTVASTISSVNFASGGVAVTGNQDDSSVTETSTTSSMIILSGTSQYLGSIDAVDAMGLDYRYALSDGEIFYAYLGTGDYDFKSIARKLGGNVVEIVTEIDILKNDLFGQKINFVNIPGITYTTIPVEERQMVFMVVWFGDDRRLVQVDFASYHRLKSTMKQSFASYY